ncbi:RNA polymerase sigma factor [Streptoalloteichus hindustanus]|uniref:RNA polymerase sigma-70 factor, sigma-E family n=1 Tax=Streptoalloteichus hindustanus TaxID=2017 RepID=A0A1M5J476_STRHI|nr:sigma-70 family RNA polymerase sigma factor [Streptoalloteichus hindustanus]SHG35407.1 RNA polymerase sigma-70 factor, sigma-E family [Streptoalloteichus hindustanus]
MDDLPTFTRLARERAAAWRRLAFLMCGGDWARAEDIVQVALVRLYKQWRRIRVDTVDAYMHTVISRLAIDESRRAYRHTEVLGEPPDSARVTSTPDDTLDVRAALRQVPQRQRAVLVLRFYSDLTVAETAKTLGVTEGTVKSQTARGLEALRSFLSDSSGRMSNEEDEVTTP